VVDDPSTSSTIGGVDHHRLLRANDSTTPLANGPRQNLCHAHVGHAGDARVADLGDPLIDRYGLPIWAA
jgi:hypothetical protein